MLCVSLSISHLLGSPSSIIPTAAALSYPGGYNLSAPRLPTGLAFSSKLRPVTNQAVLSEATQSFATITWPYPNYNNLGNTTYVGLRYVGLTHAVMLQDGW